MAHSPGEPTPERGAPSPLPLLGTRRSPHSLLRKGFLLLPLGLGLGFLFAALPRGPDFGEGSPVPPPPPLPPQRIHISLEVEAEGLVDRLEEILPERLGDPRAPANHPTNPALLVAFVADRGPFRSELRGDTLHVLADIRYGGRAWDPFAPDASVASCGLVGDRPQLGAEVALVAPLDISEGWELAFPLSVVGIEPATEADRCLVHIPPLTLDATEAILALATEWLETRAAQVQASLADYDLRGEAERGWAQLNAPFALEPGLHLHLGAEELALAFEDGLAGEGEVLLRGTLQLVAHPRLLLGPPPIAAPAELPPLFRWSEAAGSMSPTSHPPLILEGWAPFAELERVALGALGGRSYEVAGRGVRVEGVELSSPGDGRLRADIEVSGPFHGTLHLIGTPTIEPATGSIGFPDLDFRVTTDDPFARVMAWGLRTFARGRMATLVRFPLAEVLLAARQGSLTALTTDLAPGITLDTQVDLLEELLLHTGSEGISARSSVRTTFVLRMTDE